MPRQGDWTDEGDWTDWTCPTCQKPHRYPGIVFQARDARCDCGWHGRVVMSKLVIRDQVA